MLAHQVHLFVESLDPLQIGLGVVCELHLLSAAHMLGAPVELSHIHRTSDLARYCMESGLPSLDRLACSFRS